MPATNPTQAPSEARTARIDAVLDAERYQQQKQAQRDADADARAGRLAPPDTYGTIRAHAARATGLEYRAPYLLSRKPVNVQMQATPFPSSRTKEADRKSHLSAWPRLSDATRRRQEQAAVRQVDGPDAA